MRSGRVFAGVQARVKGETFAEIRHPATDARLHHVMHEALEPPARLGVGEVQHRRFEACDGDHVWRAESVWHYVALLLRDGEQILLPVGFLISLHTHTQSHCSIILATQNIRRLCTTLQFTLV